MFGVVLVGTYTSVFIAAPILIYLGVGTGRERPKAGARIGTGPGGAAPRREGSNRARPHLPRRAPIDAYGKGGFRFAGMSHRGSLLCLPSGIWAWPVARAAEIDEAALAPVFARGRRHRAVPARARATRRGPCRMRCASRFRALNINVEVTRTGTAVSTYNILLGEGRRVAAGLIAVISLIAKA